MGWIEDWVKEQVERQKPKKRKLYPPDLGPTDEEVEDFDRWLDEQEKKQDPNLPTE